MLKKFLKGVLTAPTSFHKVTFCSIDIFGARIKTAVSCTDKPRINWGIPFRPCGWVLCLGSTGHGFKSTENNKISW